MSLSSTTDDPRDAREAITALRDLMKARRKRADGNAALEQLVMDRRNAEYKKAGSDKKPSIQTQSTDQG